MYLLKDIVIERSEKEIISKLNFEQTQPINRIIGDNGSGKSTLCNLFSGLIKQKSGDIYFNGSLLSTDFFKSILRFHIGGMSGFYPRLSGIDNLIIFSIFLGSKINKKHALELIYKTGLNKSQAVDLFSNYSLGMRQRLHLARTMIPGGEVYIFDEPTNGIDSKGKEMFNNYINLLSSEKKTVIIVTHDHDILKRIEHDKITL